MKHHRTLAVACLLAFGLAAADQAAAKKTPSPDPSSGYPNGRPWEAVDADFQIVFARIDAVKKDTVVILQRLDVIEDDLAALSNTLTVQVSVVPNANRAGATNVPVVLNVLVSQNGAGVSGILARIARRCRPSWNGRGASSRRAGSPSCSATTAGCWIPW